MYCQTFSGKKYCMDMPFLMFARSKVDEISIKGKSRKVMLGFSGYGVWA